MLLLSTSPLSVTRAKTRQTPRKGAKVLAQKKSKREQSTTKSVAQPEKPSREEDAILRAAEKYHQQISGKKTEPVAVRQSTRQTLVRSIKTTEIQSSGPERDVSVNIFTGNPGYYQAEGDTLNFFSFTPVPVDSLSHRRAVAEQPGKPYGFVGKPMKAETQDWTFFLVVIGWVIFASLKFGFSKYIVQVFQSIFNFSAAARLYRERGYSNNFGMFRLNLIFFLLLPFSIYLIARDNGMSIGFAGIEFYLILFLVGNGYFMLKILLYKLLGSVFSQRETTGELVFNMMLFHNVLGMILLPVATIHSMVPAFGPFSLFIVPVLIVIFYLMSIIRSIYFAVREGISIFYLILYLCTLEILPILLVVKLAIGG